MQKKRVQKPAHRPLWSTETPWPPIGRAVSCPQDVTRKTTKSQV